MESPFGLADLESFPGHHPKTGETKWQQRIWEIQSAPRSPRNARIRFVRARPARGSTAASSVKPWKKCQTSIAGAIIRTATATRTDRPLAAGGIKILNQKRKLQMKMLRLSANILTLLAAGILAGCSGTSASPDVAASIRKSLDEAGFKDVSVSQDREKGIVTLGGKAVNENDKSQAESLAKSLAGSQVVADQIAVIPIGAESDAKAMNSDLDSGIEKNLDAALIQNTMHDLVKYAVKSAVVTLTGEVNSQLKRDRAEKVAAGVPNVRQVVNDLQVKDQKASSSPY
jgi:osmotically-inducible protein OsmY